MSPRQTRHAWVHLLVGAALVIAGCGPSSGQAAATPTHEPTPPPTERPMPTPDVATADEVLATLHDPHFDQGFEVTGELRGGDQAIALDGRLVLTTTGTRLEVEAVADGTTTLLEGVVFRGRTYVRIGDEVPWFDETDRHRGSDLAVALRLLDTLEPAGAAPTRATSWRFIADPDALVTAHLPAITRDAKDLTTSLEIEALADGALAGIDLAATWADRQTGDDYELELDLRPAKVTELEIEGPEPVWQRIRSERYDYSLGIPLDVEANHDLADADFYVIGDGEFVSIVREDQGRPADLTAYVAAFAQANEANGWVPTVAGSMTVGSRSFPSFRFIRPLDGQERVWSFALAVSGNYAYQMVIIVAPEHVEAGEQFFGMLLSTFRAHAG